MSKEQSFLVRHEFLLRRLHSLSGLIPVGAYMCVHLLVNALTMVDVAAFQNAVHQIHALGPVLPLVEWGFIFLPIIFHVAYGFVIMATGSVNTQHYPERSNIRYVLQRVTGMLAFVFIFMHVLHLHGWIHVDAYLKAIQDWGLARFKPYNASSTLGEAMQANILVPIFYVVGVLSCVFHFANGVWTMGITWGVWVTPSAQKRAGIICALVGVFFTVVGLSAVIGAMTIVPAEAKTKEDRIYEKRLELGTVIEDEHKRSSHEEKK